MPLAKGDCTTYWLLVGEAFVVEWKAVDALAAIHVAQLMTYMKITGHSLAMLITFIVLLLKDGVKRVVLS